MTPPPSRAVSALARLTAELQRRLARFARAAEVAGLDAARAREAREAENLSTAAAALLLTQAESRADLALKLTVLIAAGEATADDGLLPVWWTPS